MYMNKEVFAVLLETIFWVEINSSNQQNTNRLFRERHTQFLKPMNQACQVWYPSNLNYFSKVHIFHITLP